MALEVTPVYRNLRTRVTFFGLEAEDLFAVLALAVVANILGRFLHREMFGLPMNVVLQYVVPVLSIPALMLFKYGKQRGYLQDWVSVPRQSRTFTPHSSGTASSRGNTCGREIRHADGRRNDMNSLWVRHRCASNCVFAICWTTWPCKWTARWWPGSRSAAFNRITRATRQETESRACSKHLSGRCPNAPCACRCDLRFREGAGDLVSRYVHERRNESHVLRELDRLHVELWRSREAAGFYLEHFLHLYFIWNPRTHHQSPDFEWKRKMKSSGSLSVSASKCIERSRQRARGTSRGIQQPAGRSGSDASGDRHVDAPDDPAGHVP